MTISLGSDNHIPLFTYLQHWLEDTVSTMRWLHLMRHVKKREIGRDLRFVLLKAWSDWDRIYGTFCSFYSFPVPSLSSRSATLFKLKFKSQLKFFDSWWYWSMVIGAYLHISVFKLYSKGLRIFIKKEKQIVFKGHG